MDGLDWSKIGAIGTIVIGIVTIVLTFIGVRQNKINRNKKSNKQIIKGKDILNNEIIQSNKSKKNEDNKQIIKGKKISKNKIKQDNK
ncbi:TPA: hypothetical protein ACSVPQ_002807 [Clostridioides difficile]|uniref:hypothetical protein n=1 Tax=Clostridioides difficile TaxID=1496 RepID=UPI000BB1EF5A|nr:hypothetical protein [Clostridioides difficile]EGT3640897.1 hypothetical protein [Clostridioides difficile]MBH7168832.1 hypothetical protein [Clostridioides difficile]MBH7847780.1 hypothetical protein [Clostridioides difficile]MBY1346704.1 hypothetical protein [Clostridioides difficile]MBY1662479.1 hypothetical protein [Clostridioides difficile]